MHRALALGQHAGSGLSLHGRTLRISEASGPGNSLAGGADGSRRSNREGQQQALSVNTGGSAQGGAFGGGAFHPQLHAHLQQQQQDSASIGGYPDFLSPSSASFPPSSPYTPNGLGGPLSPPIASPRPIIPLALGSSGAGGQQGQGERGNHTTDPNNTTVFVGGLPACISEETLKVSFRRRPREGYQSGQGLTTSLAERPNYSPSSTTLARSPTARSQRARAVDSSSSSAEPTPSSPLPR